MERPTQSSVIARKDTRMTAARILRMEAVMASMMWIPTASSKHSSEEAAWEAWVATGWEGRAFTLEELLVAAIRASVSSLAKANQNLRRTDEIFNPITLTYTRLFNVHISSSMV